MQDPLVPPGNFVLEDPIEVPALEFSEDSDPLDLGMAIHENREALLHTQRTAKFLSEAIPLLIEDAVGHLEPTMGELVGRMNYVVDAMGEMAKLMGEVKSLERYSEVSDLTEGVLQALKWAS